MIAHAVESRVGGRLTQPVGDDGRVAWRQSAVAVPDDERRDGRVLDDGESPEHRRQTRQRRVDVPNLGSQLHHRKTARLVSKPM